MAAKLLQQRVARASAPYASKGVVGLKATDSLMGGLQERQAVHDAQGGAMADNASMVDLANALRSGASYDAIAAASGTVRNPAGYDPVGLLRFNGSCSPCMDGGRLTRVGDGSG